MNIRILLLIIPALIQVAAFGQEFRGLILEQGSDNPVADVVVSGDFAQQKTVSNKRGEFRIVFQKKGIRKIRFTHLGYQSLQTEINTSTDSILTVRLMPKENSLHDAEIVAPIRRQVLTRSYSQSTIDAFAIEEKVAGTLIDVLEDVPGITKRSEYHSPLVLRGLGGKRLLITEDGNRRMGNFSGSFMGQSINVNDLAKVEVIKGPASVQYGPGAMTGIINLVSKSPYLESGWHGKASSGYGQNNNERTGILAVNYADMDNAVALSGRWRDAGDYTCGLGEKSANTAYQDKDIRVVMNHEGDNYVNLRLVSELHIGGPWGRAVGFNGSTNMRIYNPHDDSWHNAISLKWQPESVLKQLEVSVNVDLEKRQQNKDSYDIGTGQLSYRESTRYKNHYAGWRCISNWALLPHALLNVGTDGVWYRISSPTEYTDYFLKSVLNNRVAQDAGVMMAGIFAEGEYKSKNNRMSLRAGLRADCSRVSEGDVHDTLQSGGRSGVVSAWNSTAGIVYELHPNVFVSFQAARSCRMPDANEMFIVNSGSDGVVYGNPDLKPERGLNFDAGIRGRLACCSFDLSIFSNFLRDFISQEYWAGSGKKGVSYTYKNVDKARISGLEFSTGTKWNGFLHPENSLIWNNSCVFSLGDKLTGITGTRDWLARGVPLRNIPPLNFNEEITLRRTISSAVSYYLSGDVRWYATQNRIAPSADGGYVSPGYCLFGASAGISHKSNQLEVELKLRGENLSDNRYRPFESLVYAMGRNVKGTVALKW